MSTINKIRNSLTYLIALIWLVNGLACKLLNYVPRHEQIVARILGEEYSSVLIIIIGVLEIAMAFWIVSEIASEVNAIVQIIIILTMNILEFIFAHDLLLWGKFNVAIAIAFCGIIYYNRFMLGSHRNILTT